MKYQDYRSEIKTGDLLAWSHTAKGSWYDFKLHAIQAATESEYSHVGLAWKYAGRVFVLESVVPYVRIMPLSNLLPFYVVHAKTPLNTEALEQAFKMIGTAEYSTWEAIMSYFGKNKNKKAWQCVEFVKEIYKTVGLNIDCKDTPTELVLALQKLAGPTQYVE